MAAIVVLNGIRITTYQLIGFRIWRTDENILDKQWWLDLQHGGWIVAGDWVHHYRRNSARGCGWINVAWVRDEWRAIV